MQGVRKAIQSGSEIDVTRNMPWALVTGAAGFLGGEVVAELLRSGWNVRCLIKCPGHFRKWNSADVEVCQGNLLLPETLESAVAGMDMVVHCAALLPGSGAPEDIWNVNVTGTENLINACHASGVMRFIFISTDSVYGDGGSAFTETAATNPEYYGEGNYPSSKLAAEELVWRYHRELGGKVTVIRPCLMYGPGESAGNKILRQWGRRRIHLVVDGGKALLSLVHVTDIARAIVLVATGAKSVGACYNVTGKPYSRRDILIAIGRVTGVNKWLISVPSVPLIWGFGGAHAVLGWLSLSLAAWLDPRRIVFASRDHVIDGAKIARELGFYPGKGLAEELATVFSD